MEAKRIFADAVKIASDERVCFLDEVCKDDAETRHEVESLLASFDDANSFMESPAVGEVAEVINQNKILETGKRFGHYEIIKQIGAGGMGEVYLAEDTKLERRVAVKILNEKFAAHESNLNRFIREAKAASALNHPNILVIHEIGEAENAHFIVSEFIEGETLREILKMEYRHSDDNNFRHSDGDNFRQDAGVPTLADNFDDETKAKLLHGAALDWLKLDKDLFV